MQGSIHFPVHFYATPAAAAKFKNRTPQIAASIFRTLIRENYPLEIAHLQILAGDDLAAFSTRLSKSGRLFIDIDVGNPNIPAVMIAEREYKEATVRAYILPERPTEDLTSKKRKAA